MSLINSVAKIIDHKKSIDEVGYLKNETPYYDDLSILDIDIKSILKQPAKNSSSQTEKELRAISEATKSRTRKEIDLVWSVDEDPLILFKNFLETKRDRKFPQATFDEYYNILEQYIYALKYYFNRARPEQIAPFYNVDIDIIYTDTHQTPSYPSGHTMYSELAAHILSDLYPEYTEEFFRLSEYCGLARILQGVHYPSDNEASKIAVRILYPKIKEMFSNEQKNQDFPINK